jgi:Animal haem peroxidase
MLVEEIPGSAAKTCDGYARFDLPRNSQNVALIADPRNDENLIVSQIQLAFLRFHNAVVADVKADLGAAYTLEEIFAEAQRIVRWHYQWMIVHEFLPTTIGEWMTTKILTQGRRFYLWRNDPYIPVEFSVGAYRFGHSQVRPSYRGNFGTSATDPTQQFFGLVFKPGDPNVADPDDLRGGCRAPRRFIDWQTFFDFGDGRAKPNKLIDTTLSTILFQLMGQATGTPDSLATRNLIRNLTMKVPSGQSVARAMRVPILAASELADLAEYHLDERTPLWFYVLREAQVKAGGTHLGPVGGRIVGEVVVGLLEGDSQSYLTQDPTWTPTYGSGGTFHMTDLLTTAGVVGSLS